MVEVFLFFDVAAQLSLADIAKLNQCTDAEQLHAEHVRDKLACKFKFFHSFLPVW